MLKRRNIGIVSWLMAEPRLPRWYVAGFAFLLLLFAVFLIPLVAWAAALSILTVDNITDTSARLKLRPNSTAVYVHYRWRPTPSGSWVYGTTFFYSNNDWPNYVERTISGLSPGVEYQVQGASDSTDTLGQNTYNGATTRTFTTTNTTSAPMFPSASTTRRVLEAAQTGDNVGAPVTATDTDTETLTYTLGGTDASSFEIGTNTGQITLASGVTLTAIDTTYSVTVTASDGSNTDTIDVTITVSRDNSAPSFSGATVSRSVPENSSEGTNVGEPVEATDDDGDPLTYSLDGMDSADYEIGSGTGQIKVGADVVLDFETNPSDTVTVIAEDSFGGEAMVEVVISITDANVAGDLNSPGNVQVERASDNSSVTISWDPPEGGADNYAVQRQELVQQEDSSFFANVRTVTGDSHLSATTFSYTDSTILSGRTYEYRAFALKGDVVGQYSDWFRTTPYETTYGDAPENLRFEDGTERDERREYWLQWDEVDGSSDYELEVNVSDLGTGEKTKRRGIVVSDATYFYTAYSRAEFRVRGRKQDADLCGSGASDRCYTGWTAWFPVGYTAPVRVELPDALMTPMPPDAKVTEMRDTMEDLVDLGTGQAGFSVAAAGVLDFIVLAAAVIVGIGAFAAARKRNLGAPGLGVAASLSIMCLWLGYIMIGSPVEWPIIASIVLFVGGALSGLRVIGLVGR